MRYVFATLALSLPLLSATAAQASCFCLVDRQLGNFLAGCQAETGADVAQCVGHGPSGPIVSDVPLGAPWSRVSGGDGICAPCMPDIRAEDLPEAFRNLVAESEEDAAEADTGIASAPAPAPKGE